MMLPNYDFPANLHEYDIIIVDLNNFNTVNYKTEDHIPKNHTGRSALSLLSSYPETIFDPRPLCSLFLSKELNYIGTRKHIIVAFTTASYDIEYDIIEISAENFDRTGIEKHNIYEFLSATPLSKPKFGKEMTVCNIRDDLKNLLLENLSKTEYNQTFHHPTKREKDKYTPDPNYIPLLRNSSDDIVSICELRDNSIIYFFPQIKEKGHFMETFLMKIAPEILPDIFPFSTTFSWKGNKEYWLPNHKKLLNEKKVIERDYIEKIELKDRELSTNSIQYSFLHEIITETGDKLVDALIKYLRWLGFDNVIKVDEENLYSSILEEDIQVELDDGLLIIECKGIVGTSTDSDCSQISKIKHRRCRARNRFDVYALYIVNHQRYLPPLSRQNPPFTENQKQDAINDERGLLSTWQLFNLYFEIENGIIDKVSARNNLLGFGFIEFRPANLTLIDSPKELFQDGYVCVVNIADLELKISDEILVEKNGKFTATIIEGIQKNDKPVTSAKDGEIGLRVSNPIKKKSILWKRTAPSNG